jgi:hypothetical protein
VSWPGWTCQPDQVPASVRDRPAQTWSSANASRRSTPGVSAAGRCSASGPIRMGRSMVALPSDRECPAAYVGRPWGTRSQRFSGKAAWSELTAAAHLILMGGCDPCAAGGTLLRQESCAKGDAVWLPGAAGRHLRLSSSCRGGTIPMTDVLPQTGAGPEHHPRPSRPAGVVAVPHPHGGRAGWRG